MLSPGLEAIQLFICDKIATFLLLSFCIKLETGSGLKLVNY